MSDITNQNPSKNNECNGSKQSNGNGKFSITKFQRLKKDRKDMKCWGCEGTGHGWKECSTPRQGNNLPFSWPPEFKWPMGGGNSSLQSSPSSDQEAVNIDRQLRQVRLSTGPE